MVAIFIDESGAFTPASLYNVVAAVSLPHKVLGRARREIARATQDWPKINGELKGGQLTAQQLAMFVDILFRHHAILHCVGVRITEDDLPTIDGHKREQAKRITRNISEKHSVKIRAFAQGLREKLEAMSLQLYAQFAAQTELLTTILEDIPNYYAQRRPAELGKLEWFVDAKDKRITPQEQWWRDILAPFMSSHSREFPAAVLHFPGFDYSYYDKSYGGEISVAGRRDPSIAEQGTDVLKVVTKQLFFIDSKSDVLIQAADILCSFIRRTLNGDITDPDVIAALGRLQLMKTERGILQSLDLLAFAESLPQSPENFALAATLTKMTEAGRSMMLPNRWKMMSDYEKKHGTSPERPRQRPSVRWRPI